MSDLIDGIGWVTTAAHWWGPNGILRALRDHLWYSAFSLALATLVGLPLGLLIGHTGRGRFAAAGAANALRAVPTIGIVMLLFRWRPVSIYPVLGGLTVLAVPPIMLNTAAGVDTVDPDARDAARGIGLSPWQVLIGVELPCALPLVLAGLRSAANQVIATATVAGFGIGLGGLGRFLFSGFGTRHFDVAYGGTYLVILLVLLVEGLFALAQRRLVSPGLGGRPRRGPRAAPPTMPILSRLPGGT